MKIGILTLTASDNCGSLLQSFALQYVLKERFGHDVQHIDFKSENAKQLYSIFPYNPLKEKRRMLNALANYNKIKKQKDDYEYFRNNLLLLTEKEYHTVEELKELSESFDCVICGSDQVWNVKMPDYSDAYFLGWYGGMKIAYAPSLGGHNLQEYESPDLIRKWLQGFTALSVREETGLQSIKELLENNNIQEVDNAFEVELLADPTLLLDTNEWQDVAGERIVEGDYIFYYSWAYNNFHVNQIVQEFSREKKMKVYVINAFKWTKFKPEQFGFFMCKKAGPLAFLSLMKYAKYALVQSFHGVIFAHKMQQNFWFLDDQPENKMDNRLNQILTLLGTKDRVLRSIDDIKQLNDETIDYERINEAFIQLITRSNQYLGKIKV